MPRMGITRGLTTWKYQDNYVERVMDNAAYTAAHPDDTLIMAGPPRTPEPSSGAAGAAAATADKLLAIGHLQQVQFTQQKPTQPVMAIGSGRTFFVSGKAQGQCTLGRLFVNGRNLLRILNHNMRRSNMNVGNFDDKPAKSSKQQYYVNLDSELYLVPFGLAALFRDKVHHTLGGFYSELSLITNYAIGLTAGQNMVMEQVSVVFDRLLPFFEHDIGDYEHYYPNALDPVMGFVDDTLKEMEAPSDRLAAMQPTAA